MSQSAYFCDEADSEIQTIYERVVLDRHMQISLQQIIAAQKLQARQSFRTSFSAPLSQKDNVHSPSLITKDQGTNRPINKEGCSPTLVSPAPRTPQSSGSHRIADEDQRSDNTTSAGYMKEETQIVGSSRILGLPHPENIRYVQK